MPYQELSLDQLCQDKHPNSNTIAPASIFQFFLNVKYQHKISSELLYNIDIFHNFLYFINQQVLYLSTHLQVSNNQLHNLLILLFRTLYSNKNKLQFNSYLVLLNSTQYISLFSKTESLSLFCLGDKIHGITEGKYSTAELLLKIFTSNIFCLFWGPYLAMLRVYSWLYTQGSFLASSEDQMDARE